MPNVSIAVRQREQEAEKEYNKKKEGWGAGSEKEKGWGAVREECNLMPPSKRELKMLHSAKVMQGDSCCISS